MLENSMLVFNDADNPWERDGVDCDHMFYMAGIGPEGIIKHCSNCEAEKIDLWERDEPETNEDEENDD